MTEFAQAATWGGGRERAPHRFSNLAESRGVTVRMCVAASEAGRLGDVVRLPVTHSYAEATSAHARVALARQYLQLLARRDGP